MRQGQNMTKSIVEVLYKPVQSGEETHFFCLGSECSQVTSTVKSLEGYQEVNLTLVYLSVQILINTVQLNNMFLKKTGDNARSWAFFSQDS